MTHLSKEDFNIWLRKAAAGDRFVYFEGYLARHNAPPPLGTEESFEVAKARAPARRLAKAVWSAKEDGLVNLAQKRIQDSVYKYYAFRTGKEFPEPDPLPIRSIERVGA